ncbi:MAG TPA: galactokinase [Gemmatimonadales bacterium]|nr:galactokinase [Gemmatimonadales bacterium]
MPTAAERAVAAFRAGFGRDPTLRARAPGRVNLIGEHVDYSDGFVLPLAIDRAVVVAAAPGATPALRAHVADLTERDSFDPAAPFQAAGGWRDYIRGVAAVLREAGIAVPPADLAIAGDVPRGGGLSSSAALEVAVARALLALAGASLDPLELARLCRRAEVEKVGVACGIMDQCASILGREGFAILLDCRSLAVRPIPLPAEAVLVVSDSGTRRSLQSSAFNQRFRECAEASALLGVAALRDVPIEALDRLLPSLPEPLRRRTRHVVQEIARTLETAAALEQGDLAAVGRFMNGSHQGLRDDYEVSTPELDALVAAARAQPGVYGSRMSGGGFGGCIISLVSRDTLEGFAERVAEQYRGVTGREAKSFAVRPSAGAGVDAL